MTRTLLNLSLGIVLGAASQTVAGAASGGGPTAPVRYPMPRAVEVTVEFVGGADKDGVYTLHGQVKSVLTDLAHATVRFVPTEDFAPVGELPSFHGTLAKDKDMSFTARVRYRDKFVVAGVGLHVEYDFPYEATKAHVETHTSEYPDDFERSQLLKVIEQRKGTRDIQASVARRHEP